MELNSHWIDNAASIAGIDAALLKAVYMNEYSTSKGGIFGTGYVESAISALNGSEGSFGPFQLGPGARKNAYITPIQALGWRDATRAAALWLNESRKYMGPNANAAEMATWYNFGGAKKVGGYGHRTEFLMNRFFK